MNKERSVLDEVAEWVADQSASSVGIETMAQARTLLLDWVACAIYGSHVPPLQALYRYISGASPDSFCRLVGQAGFQDPMSAVMFNGAAAFASRLTAAIPWMVTVTPSVVAAALAAAEEVNATLDELLLGITAGCELVGRLSEAWNPRDGNRMNSFGDRGFTPNAVCAPFGAAAAVAHIRHQDRETMAHTISLASSSAGSLGSWDQGRPTANWALTAGKSARAGLESAALAEAGVHGSNRVFEPDRGAFFHVVGSPADQRVFRRLLEDPPCLSRFVFPTLGWLEIHPYLDAVRRLTMTLDLQPGDIEQVICQVPPRVFRREGGHHARGPVDYFDVRYRLPLSLALETCTHDSLALPETIVRVTQHEAIQQLAARIVLEENPDIQLWPPSPAIGLLTVRLTSGELVRAEAAAPDLPDAWWRAGPAAVVAKARRILSEAFSPAQADAWLQQFEQCPGDTPIRELLLPQEVEAPAHREVLQ